MAATHTHQHSHGGSPTAVLVQEHDLILQALDALETMLTRLEAGSGPDRTYFEKAVEFPFEAQETGAGVHEASLALLEALKAGAR